MRTEGMTKRLRGGAAVLVLGLMLCGWVAGAQTQEPVPIIDVRTRAVPGASGDTVVASLVDTGLRTGASVVATLRVLDANGAIVAETTSAVSAGTPLRLRYRAPSTAGVSAQVLIPLGPDQLAAPVMVLERWAPAFPLTAPKPLICAVAPRMGDDGPSPGPTTDCEGACTTTLR